MSSPSFWERFIQWAKRNILCRLGFHELKTLFCDDELPNPVVCFRCGYGFKVK